MKLLNFTIFLLCMTSLVAQATNDNSLSKIQNDVLILKSSINQTNKQIHLKNQEYKDVLKELKLFDEKARIVKFTLDEYKQKIKIDYLNLQKNWNILIMQNADDLRHAEYLLTHKKIMENLRLRSNSLKKNISWASHLEKDLLQTHHVAEELKIKSEVLLGLIQKLEGQKIAISSQVLEKNVLMEKNENIMITKNLEEKISRGDFYLDKNFILPISNYKKIEKSESGINFYYGAASSLIAPASGKIIYVGELSNYGNVIMIEHDNKMISVLLGDIRSDIEELSVVSKGSIIGKLNADRDGGLRSLYYEIRKEEKPVPTLSYLKI